VRIPGPYAASRPSLSFERLGWPAANRNRPNKPSNAGIVFSFEAEQFPAAVEDSKIIFHIQPSFRGNAWRRSNTKDRKAPRAKQTSIIPQQTHHHHCLASKQQKALVGGRGRSRVSLFIGTYFNYVTTTTCYY